MRLLCMLLILGLLASTTEAAYLTHGGSYDSASSGISVASIDGKTQGNTTVYTNASGLDFYVTEVYIVLTSVAGLGTPPVVNVGKTASTYTDIVNGFALTALTLADTVIAPTLVAGRIKLANGETLVCRVATAAVLTTTYTFTVVVKGFYL